LDALCCAEGGDGCGWVAWLFMKGCLHANGLYEPCLYIDATLESCQKESHTLKAYLTLGMGVFPRPDLNGENHGIGGLQRALSVGN
jgi:hypothetical protein